MRKAGIVGVAESDIGKTPHLTVLSQQALAAKAALDEAGLTKDDVDALFTAGAWGWAPTVMLAEYLGIQPVFTDSTNIGGASFEAHVGHAAAAIEAGLIDVALVTYGSTQKTGSGRGGSFRNATLTGQYDLPYGVLAPVTSYALAAMRHMHQYGTTSEQLAEVAVAARQWAALNPRAYRREPLTVADVIASPLVCDPLHKLDCCLVTDGGGAVLVVAEDRFPDVATTPIRVPGHGETHTHNSIMSMPDLTVTGAAQTGPTALGMAGVEHDDFDVVEIYDSFTITVLLTLESLGFCKPGESGDFVSGGRIAPGGDFPMNTNGGGLSYTHPGMYGIFLLIEAVRQLRGECGDRQVADAELALVHGTGGVLSATASVVLAR